MIDRFDADVRAWMDERGQPDRAVVSSLLAGVDQLPARPRRPSPWVLAAAVLIVVSAALIVPRLSSLPVGVDRPTPPDPAAFADDARLRQCFGDAGPVEFVFVMPRARDYQRHFPAMLLSPELDVDEAGFVVVFAAGAQPAIPRAGPAGSSPEERFVCVLVGDSPNLYSDVDITGMRVDIGTAAASATPPAPTTPLPSEPSTPTPGPAPAWAADLLGQLDCDGPPSTVGGELEAPGGLGEAGSVISAEVAMTIWPETTAYVGFPLRGYVQTELDGHWARFVYRVSGRTKAVIILSNSWDGSSDVWSPAALRACNPAEFDLAAGVTGGPGPIWFDADERPVPTTTISERQGPEHCGWETVTFLRLSGDLFLRDPNGVLRDQTAGAFRELATVPTGAESTDYHALGRTIWRGPNADFIYVVTEDSVERWARADANTACA